MEWNGYRYVGLYNKTVWRLNELSILVSVISYLFCLFLCIYRKIENWTSLSIILV
jgi:hypothetical protein